MQSPIDGGVVLITGASSGIGRAIALHIGARAKVQVLVARRRSLLEALAAELTQAHPGLTVQVEEGDLGDLDQAAAMLERVRGRFGEIDVLVNNAGFGDLGVYDMVDWARTAQMIAVNVTALAFLTRQVLPAMVARGRGGVLQISSGFGLYFLPGGAAYVGTKHFVTGFSEALRLELHGTGVRVTQVCPGPVATEFSQNVGNFTGQQTPKWSEISAEHCARAAVAGLDRDRAMVIPGLLMKVVSWIASATPRFLHRLVLAPIGGVLRRRQAAVQGASGAPPSLPAR